MRRIATALLLGLALAGPAAPPATAQPAQQAEAVRALERAETELREAMEEGRPGAGPSRLRQALSEVERAMMQLPAESRRGAAWQTAVRELTEARKDGAEPEAQRAAAQRLLATLPALRGEDTATGSS